MWRRGGKGSRRVSFSADEVERYARHLVLREVGGPGQQALKAAKVLIVGAGGRRLNALNPHVAVEDVAERLTDDNAQSLMAGFDLTLDGTDDFATRFAVNAACVATGVPLVSGAIGRWTGQVGAFAGQPCYRCLVPETPPEAETCSVVGVVGALAGVIGAMMAAEAVKLIAGAGDPLTGRLLIYDALAAETRTLTIAADPACPVCGGRAGGAVP